MSRSGRDAKEKDIAQICILMVEDVAGALCLLNVCTCMHELHDVLFLSQQANHLLLNF
jgi:hypothetical protein